MLLALAWALPTLAWAAGGECIPTELPAPTVDRDASGSFVRLQLVDPAYGGAVDADSTVVVDVDYRVADFKPGEYGLMIYFAALVASTSPFGPEGRYELQKASGRVRLCVPLREIYSTPRLRWPLEMSVTLNRREEHVSPRFSAMFASVADSKRVPLNSVQPTDETRRLQGDAVEPAYRDAVTVLMGMVTGIEAAGTTCASLPELEVEYTAAHRAWTSRNHVLAERVRTLQRDLHLRDIARPDIVDEVMNLQMTTALNRLDELAPDQLRAICRRQLRALSDPRSDLETAGAAQLAVIRAQAPSGEATKP
jgi:hypothetical protein